MAKAGRPKFTEAQKALSKAIGATVVFALPKAAARAEIKTLKEKAEAEKAEVAAKIVDGSLTQEQAALMLAEIAQRVAVYNSASRSIDMRSRLKKPSQEGQAASQETPVTFSQEQAVQAQANQGTAEVAASV